MKWASVLRAAGLAGSVLLIPVLWNYWGSICNESCEVGRALTMQALSITLPASIFLATLAWTAPRSSNLFRYASLVGGLLLSLLGVYVTLAK